MISIFTVPKAFASHDGVIQTNAIESWVRLGGGHEIILFGDDPGVAEVAKKYGLRHVPDIARNDKGTPLIGDGFNQAAQIAKYDILCLVNADIILLDDFPGVVQKVADQHRRFLLIGRRTNLDINELIDFSRDWRDKIRQRAALEGQIHGPHSTDFFAYHRDVFQDIPPFAIGRTAWDNWLMYEARRVGAELIDATPSLLTVHQNHDYNHVPEGWEGAWKGEESRKNVKLAGGYRCMYSAYDASLLLKKGKLVSTYWPWYWGRHFGAWKNRTLTQWLADHPSIHRMIRRIRGKDVAVVSPR